MKINREITINIDCTSQVSEVALEDYMNSLVDEITGHIEDIPLQDWRNSISVSWDQSYPVMIEVDVKVTK